ncbi:hypothetical protein FQN60_009397 [Etheostoma spectabile]|uniref:Uncharacterized protein n=1 Tax=Etheostoma spectabile TaxID=54343 RepID=A0A5J5DIY8_9PERO|nr:hypothetical protein FQN60_009397 [Etheostoma spectabile]
MNLPSAHSDPAVGSDIVRLEAGRSTTLVCTSGDQYDGGGQAWAAQLLGDVTSSLVWQVVDPAEDGLEHCVFSFHVEVIALNDSSQLRHGELQQLLGDTSYLLKAV